MVKVIIRSDYITEDDNCPLCGDKKWDLYRLSLKTKELRVAGELVGEDVEYLCSGCWTEVMGAQDKDDVLALIQDMLSDLHEKEGNLNDKTEEIEGLMDKARELENEKEDMFTEEQLKNAEKEKYQEGYERGETEGGEAGYDDGYHARIDDEDKETFEETHAGYDGNSGECR